MHRMFRRKPFLVLGLTPCGRHPDNRPFVWGPVSLCCNINEAANQRQQDLLKLVVTKLEAEVAHNQESATVWDDAVVEERRETRIG